MTDKSKEDPVLAELRGESPEGSRLQDADKELEIVDRIQLALEEIDDGELNKTASVYDANTAAILHALDNDDDKMMDVVSAFQRQLGREMDVDDADKSTVLRLAVRVALKDAAPEVYEAAKEAHTRRITEDF